MKAHLSTLRGKKVSILACEETQPVVFILMDYDDLGLAALRPWTEKSFVLIPWAAVSNITGPIDSDSPTKAHK